MSKQHDKREARRKKILNNSKDRWNKINGSSSEISYKDSVLVKDVPTLSETVFGRPLPDDEIHDCDVFKVVSDEVQTITEENQNHSLLMPLLQSYYIKHDLFLSIFIAGFMSYVFIKWKSLYKIFTVLYYIVFIMKECKDLEMKKQGADKYKTFILYFGLTENRLFPIFKYMMIVSNFIRYQCSIYILSLILAQKTLEIFIYNHKFLSINV
ncbi:hypothetical protein TKK_0013835 [Trichogramma kaykai]|uniref:Uncharacterized protein n=1 Tax=Trichogramma kaykai TaxID=54128 RepID=A0ABD2WIG1_9HYME